MRLWLCGTHTPTSICRKTAERRRRSSSGHAHTRAESGELIIMHPRQDEERAAGGEGPAAAPAGSGSVRPFVSVAPVAASLLEWYSAEVAEVVFVP
ncbi:hypothetical protein Y032_0135g1906 [Ancylostoma ceylanicum]|uniref:Uncharacterized protein n=1 Tax=Ancylostoma ceylanicum TaxID=53326 RepID=A0A016T5R0_9BILA|nr:hypothetical protein Y032_0135g1906 [Ancylostoma ceylanicum]